MTGFVSVLIGGARSKINPSLDHPPKYYILSSIFRPFFQFQFDSVRFGFSGIRVSTRFTAQALVYFKYILTNFEIQKMHESYFLAVA